MKSRNEFISLLKYSFKLCRPFSKISHAKSFGLLHDTENWTYRKTDRCM